MRGDRKLSPLSFLNIPTPQFRLIYHINDKKHLFDVAMSDEEILIRAGQKRNARSAAHGI